jgi:hypothetical protein
MPAVYSRHGTLEHHLRPRRTLTLRLYSNDFTPHRNQSLADFTEADFPGYKPIRLAPSDWSVASESPLTLACPTQEFTLTEDLAVPALVHGHYLTDDDDVVLAEDSRLGKLPHSLEIKHSRLKVTPTIGER